MKKVIVIISLAFLLVFATTVSASPATDKTSIGKGPFAGTFNGMVYGDKGSKAPISLSLSHRGNNVEGTVYLGEGLFVDAGMCGSGYVPAGAQYASGRTSTNNPRHLQAESSFKVNGFNVTVDLDGDLSPNSNILKTQAKIDLPWLCGGDPVIQGTLFRS